MSDVPSIGFFFKISCKILCKNPFNLFFYNFTKITIMSFECHKSEPATHCFIFQSIKIILGPSDAWSMRQSTQQPCVLYWRLSDFWTSSSSENHSLSCLKMVHKKSHYWMTQLNSTNMYKKSEGILNFLCSIHLFGHNSFHC